MQWDLKEGKDECAPKEKYLTCVLLTFGGQKSIGFYVIAKEFLSERM